MRVLRIENQQQEPGVLALGPGLAMLDEDLAGDPDQMVGMMRHIGDDRSIPDRDGRTALEHAKAKGYREIAAMLEE